MARLVRWCVWSVLIAAPAFAIGHSKTAAIDLYCSQVKQTFSGADPYVFTGPEPWVQIDEVPASMPDDALAYVYTAGADIRWVFVRIVDRDSGWSEDIDYFFREDGSLAKRERHVQSAASNIRLEVFTYYAEGRVVKEKSHHHSLGPGKADSSQFNDPDAPVFWWTEDLPFPEITDFWKRLA